MKNFGKILYVIILMCMVTIIDDVNAETIDLNTCSFTINGPSEPVDGYNLYTQKLVCGTREFDFYCIDAGVANPRTTNNMSVSYVKSPGLNEIFSSKGDYFQKQVALRVWASRAGLSTANTKAMQKIVGKEYNDPTFLKSWDLGNKASKSVTTSQISGESLLNLLVTDVTKTGDNFTAIVSVTALDSNIDLSKIGWTSSNSRVDSSQKGKQLTITGTMEECKGAKVKLKADISNAGTPGGGDTSGSNGIPGGGGTSGSNGTPGGSTPGTTSSYIYFKPKSNLQAGIVYVPNNDIIFVDGGQSDGTDGNEGEDGNNGNDGNNGEDSNNGNVGNNKKYSFTLNIPDPDCDCSGTTTLQGACDLENSTSYYVKDSEKISECITSGYYKDYCGKDIQKETDNNLYENKTNITETRDKTNVKLSDNRFCKVYCIENVEYNFPGLIEAKSGKYFKLQDKDGKRIKLSGTRICYTDEIKKSYYINEIKAKQEAVISAMNNYLYQKARQESIDKAQSESIELCVSYSCNSNGNAVRGTTVTGNKFTGKKVKYKKYEATYDKNGAISDLDSEEYEVQVEWQDSITEGSSSPCSKSGNAVTCGTMQTATSPTANPDEGAVNAALKNMYDTINEYKSCFEWNNNYCFNPKIEFSYDEPYNDMMKGELSSKKGSSESKEQFSTTSIETTDIGDNTYVLTPVSYINKTGDTLTTQISNIDMTNTYVAKYKKEEREFADSTKEVWSYKPYGTIVTSKSDCTKSGNCKYLGYVLPVALEHEDSTVLYNYYLDINNVGMAGDDNVACENYESNERLMGSDCSLYKTEATGNIGDKEYKCQYKVNDCPECQVTCACPDDNPGCYVEDEICKYIVCDYCIVESIGSLWNVGDATFGYKQVSLSDVFPNSDNNKDVGYNWNTNASVNPQAEKAEATIEEIEQEAEEAYKKPEYSYTLTPATLNKIRLYNEAANGDTKKNLPNFGEVDIGGYSNDTLTCPNGEKCTSSFLDGLDSIVGTNNYTRSDKWKVFNKTTKLWEEK